MTSEIVNVRRAARRPAARLARLAIICVLLSPGTSAADVVLDWNVIAVNTAISNAQNPFAQARFAAIAQLAVFEAVNAATGDYEPYLGTVTAPAGASPEAAAIAAAYRVLRTYFPASATALDAARASSLAAIPDSQSKTDGISTGEAAAAAMIANRASDRAAPAAFYTPGPRDDGAWQVTPSCPVNPATGLRSGVLYQWGGVTPFGIPSAADFMPDAPPALDSSAYRKDYDEVMAVGSLNSGQRPQDRADVARFYAASSPTYLLNSVARQLAAAQGRSLSENARALALINMSISDSLVTSFATKYHYVLWRPETAILAAGGAGFVPYIVTPCFPSYPSNHASGTSGGAEVLRRLYGAGEHAITLTNPAVAGITLNYTTLKQITSDVDDARVFGGIHFRFDQEAGNQIGRAVGTYVYKHNLARAKNED